MGAFRHPVAAFVLGANPFTAKHASHPNVCKTAGVPSPLMPTLPHPQPLALLRRLCTRAAATCAPPGSRLPAPRGLRIQQQRRQWLHDQQQQCGHAVPCGAPTAAARRCGLPPAAARCTPAAAPAPAGKRTRATVPARGPAGRRRIATEGPGRAPRGAACAVPSCCAPGSSSGRGPPGSGGGPAAPRPGLQAGASGARRRSEARQNCHQRPVL